MADQRTEKTRQQPTSAKSEPAATSPARTSPIKSTATGATATVTDTVTGTSAPTSRTVTTSTDEPPPEAAPRNGVAVNVASVVTAFRTGSKSRSVRVIQDALRARGFTVGNDVGLADHTTRASYAKFQRSINERATGLPTADSLDHLGFDVVG